MEEEFWTKRDGTKIAVGDMDLDHLRNTLRMIIRNRRRLTEKLITTQDDDVICFPEENCQTILNEEHYRALAEPNAFFPLLEGGVYGSKELQEKYGQR